jgi:hypothetical protein
MTQLELFVAWLQQPMTTGAAIVGIVGYFFYWLGSKNSHVPAALVVGPTEEELKKAQEERDVSRRKIVRNTIAGVLYKELMKAFKENKRNKNAGLTSAEAYSQACNLFTQLRVPDAIVDIKKDLGIIEGKIDAPPKTNKEKTQIPPGVDIIADNMAKVKARLKAKREAEAAAA